LRPIFRHKSETSAKLCGGGITLPSHCSQNLLQGSHNHQDQHPQVAREPNKMRFTTGAADFIFFRALESRLERSGPLQLPDDCDSHPHIFAKSPCMPNF
jgi:hypothetical protein